MSIVVRKARPDFLVDAAQTVSIVLERAGVVLTPTVGTYTLLDATGTAVTGLSGVTATTLGGTTSATYNISASALDSVDPSDRYTSQWALTVDGAVNTYRREAFIVSVSFFPPITEDDLVARLSDLDGDYELPTNKNWQDYIDEADLVIIARMLAEGIAPQELTSWYAFRETYCRYTEAGIAKDLRLTRSGSTRWAAFYDELMGPVEDPRSIEWAWAHKGYRLDRDGDGVPDATGADESRPGNYWNNASEGGSRGF